MNIPLPATITECHELIKQLVELIDTLVLRVEQLEQENKALKERLDTNSSNSSKPPSQDFKKKKTKKKPNPNKGGGVKGHQGHFQKLLPVDEVNEIVSCKLPKRCVCGENKITHQDVLKYQVYRFSINCHS